LIGFCAISHLPNFYFLTSSFYFSISPIFAPQIFKENTTMEAFDNYLNTLMNRNRTQYEKFGKVKWLNPYLAEEMEAQRSVLESATGPKLQWGFNRTKPWINQISKGCQLCGKGEWSCLFITGVCNANCFYCPTSQTEDHLPTTQQISFEYPADYAAYINRFGFKGASFSGGEPFLAFEKVKAFLTELRKSCTPDLYIWMYTNGLLATREKFETLRDLGLNEVRFDIGATRFSLDFVKLAKGIIPTVTIEIPAVPGELDKLKQLLPEMVEAGVTNLNLHQMRLTPHNAPKLLKYNYTYLSLEHPVVWESELVAFELMKEVKEQNLPLGVNYCAFQFKNRHQKAGFRNRIIQELHPQTGQITENGFIRHLFFATEPIWNHLKNNPQEWPIERMDKELLALSIEELAQFKDTLGGFIFWYQGMEVKDGSPGSGLQIGHKTYEVETAPATPPLFVSIDQLAELNELFRQKGSTPPVDEVLFQIWQKEFIEVGFRRL